MTEERVQGKAFGTASIKPATSIVVSCWKTGESQSFDFRLMSHAHLSKPHLKPHIGMYTTIQKNAGRILVKSEPG